MEERRLKRNHLWPIIIQRMSPSNCLRQFRGDEVGVTAFSRRKFTLKHMGDSSHSEIEQV